FSQELHHLVHGAFPSLLQRASGLMFSMGGGGNRSNSCLHYMQLIVERNRVSSCESREPGIPRTLFGRLDEVVRIVGRWAWRLRESRLEGKFLYRSDPGTGNHATAPCQIAREAAARS